MHAWGVRLESTPALQKPLLCSPVVLILTEDRNRCGSWHSAVVGKAEQHPPKGDRFGEVLLRDMSYLDLKGIGIRGLVHLLRTIVPWSLHRKKLSRLYVKVILYLKVISVHGRKVIVSCPFQSALRSIWVADNISTSL